MDAMTFALLANAALAVATIATTSFFKLGYAARAGRTLANANFAGASGALIGLGAVMSVGAMFA